MFTTLNIDQNSILIRKKNPFMSKLYKNTSIVIFLFNILQSIIEKKLLFYHFYTR